MWKKIYYDLGNSNNFTSYYHCHENGQIIPCPNFYDNESKIKCQCGKSFECDYTDTIKIQDYWHKEVLRGKYLIHHNLTSIKHIHDGSSHKTCVNKKKQHECCDCHEIFDETIDPTKYEEKKLPVNGEIKYYLLKNANLWIFVQDSKKYFFLHNGKEKIFEAIKISASKKDLICLDDGREKNPGDLIFTIKSLAEIDDIFSQVNQLREELEKNSRKKGHDSTQPLQFGFDEIFINLKEKENTNIPSIPKKPKRKKKKSSTTPWQGEKIDSIKTSKGNDGKNEIYTCSSEQDNTNQTTKNEVISLDENLEEITEDTEQSHNSTEDTSTEDNSTEDNYQVEELSDNSIDENVLAKDVAKLVKEDLKIFLKVKEKRFEKKFDQAQSHMSNYSLSVMDNLENNETKTIEKIQEEKDSTLKKIVNIAQEKENSIAKEQEISQKAFSEHLQEKAKDLDQNHKANLKAYEKKISQVKPEITRATRTTAYRLLKTISVLAIISILVSVALSSLLYKRYREKEKTWQQQYGNWQRDVQKVEKQQKKIQLKWQELIANTKNLDKYVQNQHQKMKKRSDVIKKKFNSKMEKFLKKAQTVEKLNQQEKLKIRNEIQDLKNQYKDLLERQLYSYKIAEKKWRKINQKVKVEKENHQKNQVENHLQALNKEIKALKQQYRKITKEINEIFSISKGLQKITKKEVIRSKPQKKKKPVKSAKKSSLIIEIRDKKGKVLQKEKQ